MAKYTLTNNFHNTETTTKYSPEDRDRIDYAIYQGSATEAEKRARSRAKRTLCCSGTCDCSNAWGER